MGYFEVSLHDTNFTRIHLFNNFNINLIIFLNHLIHIDLFKLFYGF